MLDKYSKVVMLMLMVSSFQQLNAVKFGPIEIDTDAIAELARENPRWSAALIIGTCWFLRNKFRNKRHTKIRDELVMRPAYADKDDDVHQLKLISRALVNIRFDERSWGYSGSYRNQIYRQFVQELQRLGVCLETSEYGVPASLNFNNTQYQLGAEVVEETNAVAERLEKLRDIDLIGIDIYEYPYQNSMRMIKQILKDADLDPDRTKNQAYVSCNILLKVRDIAQEILNHIPDRDPRRFHQVGFDGLDNYAPYDGGFDMDLF
jgi:hypothetical protein